MSSASIAARCRDPEGGQRRTVVHRQEAAGSIRKGRCRVIETGGLGSLHDLHSAALLRYGARWCFGLAIRQDHSCERPYVMNPEDVLGFSETGPVGRLVFTYLPCAMAAMTPVPDEKLLRRGTGNQK